MIDLKGILYDEADINTGEITIQTTRKWYISPHISKSEFVQTAFKCLITSMEHRAREKFKYKGKRVYGPHFDVEELHKICTDKKFDYREQALQDGGEWENVYI